MTGYYTINCTLPTPDPTHTCRQSFFVLFLTVKTELFHFQGIRCVFLVVVFFWGGGGGVVVLGCCIKF